MFSVFGSYVGLVESVYRLFWGAIVCESIVSEVSRHPVMMHFIRPN